MNLIQIHLDLDDDPLEQLQERYNEYTTIQINLINSKALSNPTNHFREKLSLV